MTEISLSDRLEAQDAQWRVGWPLKIAAALFALIVASGISFVVFEPIQVLPRIRLAPGYALTTHDSELLTSESARGAITLYSFAPTDCGSQCEAAHATMAEIGSRLADEIDLGEVEFRQITIALDAEPESDQLKQASDASGADDAQWRWVGGSAVQIGNIVGSGFQIFYEEGQSGGIERFDPGFILVDGAGVIRGEYRYQTIAADADKIIHHVGILSDEVRNATGATAVAYEAAHLFLCYP